MSQVTNSKVTKCHIVPVGVQENVAFTRPSHLEVYYFYEVAGSETRRGAWCEHRWRSFHRQVCSVGEGL